MSKSTKPIIQSENYAAFENLLMMPGSDNNTLEKALEELADHLIEEQAISVLSEQGRDLRWGILTSNGILDPVPPELLINDDSPAVDIFGQLLSKKPNFECECPKCNRMLAAARFAPHLEKCMGMGRNSSRIASRRLAATGSNSSASVALSDITSASSRSSVASNSSGASSSQIGELPSEDEHFEEDIDDDEDWTMDRKKKTVKKSSEKSTPKRKGPLSRIKNVEARGRRGGSPSVSVTSSPASSIVDAGIEDDSLDPLSLP